MSYKDTESYQKWLVKRFPKKTATATQEVREEVVNEKREFILKYGFANVKGLNELEKFYIKIKMVDENLVISEGNERMYISA